MTPFSLRPRHILAYVLALVLATLAGVPASVRAADGSGTVAVSPSSAYAAETGATFAFAYAPSEALQDGALRLTVPSGWTAPTTTPGVAGYTAVSGATVGTTLDALDSASGWSDNSLLITTSADSSVKRSGAASLRVRVTASLAGGQAYRDFSSGQDWSGYDKVSFWFRTSATLGAGDLSFALSESAGLGGTPATYAIPGPFLTLLGPNAWGHVVVDLSGTATSTRDSVRSFGFRTNVAALTDFHFDNVVIGPALPTVSGTEVTIPLVSLPANATATVTYGAGGGAQGVAVPSASGTAAFGFAQRLSSAGSFAALAVQPSVTVLDPGPPGVPTGLSIVPGDEQFVLSWAVPATGGSPFQGYDVEYRAVGETAWIPYGAIGTEQPVLIAPFTNGTTYQVRIRAFTALGAGSFSAPATATPRGAPTAPGAVSAERGDGMATVSFFPPESDGGYPVTGYEVEVLDTGATTSVTSSPATIAGLTNGTPYAFSVRARNAYGLGAAQASGYVTPAGVPGAPGAATGTASWDQAALAWEAADPRGDEITDYQVRYRVAGAGSWIVFEDGPSAEPSALVTGLEPETDYEFSVAAVNGVGTGPDATVLLATPAFSASVPQAPYALTTARGADSMGVSWSAPADGGSAITDYVIEYRAAGAGSWTSFEDGIGAEPSATVTGLLPATGYEFRVAAVNGAGTGPWSEPAADYTDL